MAESEGGTLILYSIFHWKPVQFKEKRDDVVTSGFIDNLFLRQVL